MRRCTGGAAQVAMDGDTVFIHYICRDEDGNVVDDSADSEEPVSFEVGAGEITGNPLFQAFDEAIRGLPLGSTTVLEAKGGDWNRELFFEVNLLTAPRDDMAFSSFSNIHSQVLLVVLVCLLHA